MEIVDAASQDGSYNSQIVCKSEETKCLNLVHIFINILKHPQQQLKKETC